MNILVHHQASAGFVRALERMAPPGASLVYVDERDREGLFRALESAEVLLHVLEPLDRATLESAPSLRLVQKIGVGVNTIDVEACRALGIGVANMPGTNTRAVAELTLTLMLAALRHVCVLDRETRSGRGFPMRPDVLDQSGELAGRTVGLVGYGAVPRMLAPILEAMEANVVVHTRAPDPSSRARFVSFDELVRSSDVVSLHVPLDATTRGLLSREHIARMKPGSILVNTARGGLVDQAALTLALRSNHLRAAGLDVFADEPVSEGDPLLGLENVVLSPHVAWRTPETLERSFAIAFENAARAIRAEALLHEIVAVKRPPT